MNGVYLGILAAGVVSAIVAWSRHKSRVIVHRVDYTEEALTVKNIGWLGAGSVILFVGKDRETVKEIADPPPSFDKLASGAEATKVKSQRLEDIPPSAVRTVDLRWFRVGEKWGQSTVCVGARWKPDSWFERVVSWVFSPDQVSTCDPRRQTFVRLPGYNRGKRQFGSDD